MSSSLQLSSQLKILDTDLENSTIQKQRKELQLLIAELKDRDKELNDMVAIHQKQMLAWEGDRQQVLFLEQKCSKLESELQQRNEIIRSLTKRIKLVQSRQQDQRASLENTLESTQHQLQELSHRASAASSQCQDLEDKNRSLSDTVLELSAHVGRLQAREQELATLLKLKDNDIIEATNHITECTSRFKELEAGLREAVQSSLNGQKGEVNKLKDDLSQKTAENNEQREEIIRLKQESSYLHSELLYAAEREHRKDQLFQLARSKQDRTDTELQNLRKICVKQQNDLQFLHLSLESSKDAIQKYEQTEDEISEGPLNISSLYLDSLGKDGFLATRQNHSSLPLLPLDLKIPIMQSTLKDSDCHISPKSCSPTLKLQRLIADSQQMVADLELRDLLPGPYSVSSTCADGSQAADTHEKRKLQDTDKEAKSSGFS
ncbi:coiled-coil domain containing 62 L homeolog [Xenopus laevis]|uniref:Coiled-coil domain containing 62 L homeolog n=2 Tax=Xenopus laevis TaxID=8355 RepID=Q641G1_XENLA|nr:coiled-coil domain containing 62 L homeolog [Xenopus laevis]AAH82376.1 MGC81703 protein [Xenopus laevis]OCU02038.1 hypothetical protein XELAEV_18007796mg [Xenopus laevis]